MLSVTSLFRKNLPYSRTSSPQQTPSLTLNASDLLDKTMQITCHQRRNLKAHEIDHCGKKIYRALAGSLNLRNGRIGFE